MEQEAKKRVRRSREEIAQAKIAKLEEKIADYKAKILEAEKEIESLKNPVQTIKKKDVWSKAEEYGLTPEQMLELVEKAGKKKNKD